MHCSVGSVGAQDSGTLIFTSSIRSLSKSIGIFEARASDSTEEEEEEEEEEDSA